jgi:dTDP-4-dehydrorhamnose reductase
MNNILVIGGKGQLGQCIEEMISQSRSKNQFIFLGSADLNITDQAQIENTFKQYQPTYCINCAAYTAVDKAEDDEAQALEINEFAVKRLAVECLKYNATLIHISTDFVFNGDSSIPLTEDQVTNPVNIYGLSKLKGEQQVHNLMEKYYIIRTSWLYSEKANNFCKTMLKLSESRDSLTVIYDQIGTPTYAMDLAEVILGIIADNKTVYGLYHYSNEGVASWYDFAKAIFELAEVKIDVKPVASSAFVTKAKRPHYSVMDKTKIKDQLGIEIPYWRDSLNICIQML